MIPSVYPIVCLLAALVLLVAILLSPYLRAFRRGWFVLASVLAIIWAGDKPTPPPGPTPPSDTIKISLVDTTASNVTINIVCTTNHVGASGAWFARRYGITLVDGGEPWTAWTDLDQDIVIQSTNSNHTVNGRFVSGRKDTQLRLEVGNEHTGEVTP